MLKLTLGALLLGITLAAAMPAGAATLDVSACAAPQFPPEAVRYEMQGTARFELTVGPDGGALNPVLSHSSGYALLDQTSLKLLASCKFDARHAGTVAHLIDVPWRLAPGEVAPQPALLDIASCTRYKLFRVVERDTPGRNMSVRIQVWPDGRQYSPRIETSSGDEDADRVALKMVESCSVTPGARDGVAVHSALLVPMVFDRAGITDQVMRAYYDRFAIEYAASALQYDTFHILVKSETVAREILAQLLAGADFGTLAQSLSIDTPSAKKGGSLGWRVATVYPPAFTAALNKITLPSTYPDPVKTSFGWHVIRVQGIRPAQMPGYEQTRPYVKTRLIAQREQPAGLIPPPAPPESAPAPK